MRFGIPENIDNTLVALHTQYQIRGDAIVARHSPDAPTMEQLSLIREAHLNIIPILKEIKRLREYEWMYKELCE